MSIQSFIYLIEAENGLVKIGRAQKVGDRLTAIRTHSPVLARLIAQWPGAAAEEQALHVEFAAFRRHGEWFEAKGQFRCFVELLRGRGVDAISPWGDLLFASRRVYWERQNSARRNASGRRVRSGVEAAKTQMGLTDKQARCLAFIRQYIAERGCSPSFQEIADGVGLISKGRVHALIHQLAARGHLSMLGRRHRAIVLVEAAAGAPELQGVAA